MDRWVDRPPAPCHRTRRDEPQAGNPYFVESTYIGEVVRDPERGAVVKPRLVPLVHSASWLRTICDSPGSPFKLLTSAEWHAVNADRAALEDARRQVAELEAELASLRQAPGVDVQALAGALVVPLSEHFARKTGRKPAA